MPTTLPDVIMPPGRIDLPEEEFIPEKIEDEDLDDMDLGNLFGKCPACGKFLRPRCRFTGEPKVPLVGAGWLSRAKCDKCGAVIEYIGDGKWVISNMLGMDGGNPDEPKNESSSDS